MIFVKGDSIRHLTNTSDTTARKEILNEFKLNLQKNRGYGAIEMNQNILSVLDNNNRALMMKK